MVDLDQWIESEEVMITSIWFRVQEEVDRIVMLVIRGGMRVHVVTRGWLLDNRL